MITLAKKLKKNVQNNNTEVERPPNDVVVHQSTGRALIRDRLLTQEVQEMEANLPTGCMLRFENPDELHKFDLFITPDEGFWCGGRFHFEIEVPEEYNMLPPKVKCLTRLWHPNIDSDGSVCLSLLRESSIDGMGWAPTRRLKEVAWGLNSLFTDLLNFDDPLNNEAAEQFLRDKDSFRRKVQEYVQTYAKR